MQQLFNVPPAEAATGQQEKEKGGGGGEMKHAGSQRRWRQIKREGDRRREGERVGHRREQGADR